MYIKAIVIVNQKKDSIEKKTKDTFIIKVKEKAERNEANKKVLELLAIYFKISSTKIRIVNGHQHPHKLLFINDKML